MHEENLVYMKFLSPSLKFKHWDFTKDGWKLSKFKVVPTIVLGFSC